MVPVFITCHALLRRFVLFSFSLRSRCNLLPYCLFSVMFCSPVSTALLSLQVVFRVSFAMAYFVCLFLFNSIACFPSCFTLVYLQLCSVFRLCFGVLVVMSYFFFCFAVLVYVSSHFFSLSAIVLPLFSFVLFISVFFFLLSFALIFLWWIDSVFPRIALSFCLVLLSFVFRFYTIFVP